MTFLTILFLIQLILTAITTYLGVVLSKSFFPLYKNNINNPTDNILMIMFIVGISYSISNLLELIIYIYCIEIIHIVRLITSISFGAVDLYLLYSLFLFIKLRK